MSAPRSDDDRIRRLLAEARHNEPIPPDVADRLDGVLADLRADRPVPATVGDLAAARRRRRARAMLVAAAAVVVAGIGIDQLRGGLSGGTADSGSSATSGRAPEVASEGGAGDRAESGADGGGSAYGAAPLPGPVVRLDSDRFSRQVARLQGADTLASEAQADRVRHAYKAAGCRAPGAGRAVPVRYDGEPGVLVFRPPAGDSQVVDLVLCGHSGTTRTITLPAP
jgi:hypothetical protein